MAVTSSDLLNTVGITKMPAKKYASTTAGPAMAKAIPGRIKRPELIIAPEAIANTFVRLSFFVSILFFIFIHSCPVKIS